MVNPNKWIFNFQLMQRVDEKISFQTIMYDEFNIQSRSILQLLMIAIKIAFSEIRVKKEFRLDNLHGEIQEWDTLFFKRDQEKEQYLITICCVPFEYLSVSQEYMQLH